MHRVQIHHPVPGIILACCMCAPVHAGDDFADDRQHLVELIEADVRETSAYIKKDALDPRVMQAMASVPRHEFVPLQVRDIAYRNRPLPIGHGQTISQPYIVAIMTDLLNLNSKDKVLEIGTGSGYQAAILAELVEQVYTIEIIKPLANEARQRLQVLGYKNISVKLADGYYGWQEHAPFDAIIVTAAASHVPPSLIKQLKTGGRMVIPVGSRFMTQELLLINKEKQGKITTQQVLPVSFVPFTGGH